LPPPVVPSASDREGGRAYGRPVPGARASGNLVRLFPASADRELAADELATTAGEDRGQAGQARDGHTGIRVTRT
jgi:hypothetical protein